jgi:hypothetical protein
VQAELEKDEIDGFTIFKDVSPQTETVDQSDASPTKGDRAPATEINSGMSSTPPLPKPNVSSDESYGEALQYQYLPVRNVVLSNYGLSAQHEFQARPNPCAPSSSTLPILSFDEVISGSISEMDLTPDGIPRSSNTTIPPYTHFAAQYSSQVSSAASPGVASQYEFGDHEKLGVQAASYTSRSPSYMPHTPGVEELGGVTEESWDFGDMNIPDDLYDTMVDMRHAEQGTLNR